MMKKILMTIVVVALPFMVNAAVEDSVMVRRVLDYYETAVPERMIIHTDKDRCEAGDKVSFRAYVVREADNFDSQRTNFIYLDLYRNDRWQRISHKKYIRNENGSYSNYFEIPETITPGKYTIVGYTTHMLGFTPETFAYKTISVGTGNEPAASDVSQFGLELYPEGGRYIEGSVQKVGVRVRGVNEMPGVFHAEVVDSIGHVLYSADTDPYGYATVKLRNDSLCPLRVNVRADNGYVLSTEVPAAETDCASLKVTHSDDILKIGILQHGDVDPAAMNVVIRASGIVFSIAADKVSQVKIPLNTLPDGDIIIDLVDDTRKTVVSTRRIFKESGTNITLTS